MEWKNCVFFFLMLLNLVVGFTQEADRWLDGMYIRIIVWTLRAKYGLAIWECLFCRSDGPSHAYMHLNRIRMDKWMCKLDWTIIMMMEYAGWWYVFVYCFFFFGSHLAWVAKQFFYEYAACNIFSMCVISHTSVCWFGILVYLHLLISDVRQPTSSFPLISSIIQWFTDTTLIEY